MTKIIKEVAVDTTNEFSYKNVKYRISPVLKQYEVVNYPLITNGKYNNWTNESDMDSVIVIDNKGEIEFLDQDGKDITTFVEQI